VIVLADNDILVKLATCDLFEEFLSAFSLTIADVRIVKAARYSIRAKRIRDKAGPQGYERLIKFLENVADISEIPDPDRIATLTEQPSIDPGEAVLFAVCPSIPDAVIVTGDKKSLIALAVAATNSESFANLLRDLRTKVFCFEYILIEIIKFSGFDSISQRLIDGRECDRCLKNCIGSGLTATEASVLEGLTSYINDLKSQVGELLAN
jgi:hypothetical protein